MTDQQGNDDLPTVGDDMTMSVFALMWILFFATVYGGWFLIECLREAW